MRPDADSVWRGAARFSIARARWGLGERRQARAELATAEQEMLGDVARSPYAAENLGALRAWRRAHP